MGGWNLGYWYTRESTTADKGNTPLLEFGFIKLLQQKNMLTYLSQPHGPQADLRPVRQHPEDGRDEALVGALDVGNQAPGPARLLEEAAGARVAAKVPGRVSAHENVHACGGWRQFFEF